MKLRRILIVAAVVLLAGVVVALGLRALNRHGASQKYSGTVETREIQVGSKIGGRVVDVGAEEGQQIRAGASLIRFESNDLSAQRRQAQAEVDQQLANLGKLERGNRPEEIQQAEANANGLRAALDAARNGPRPQDIAQAQADYEAAKADATNSQADFDRMEKLVATDTISRMKFDSYRNKRDSSAKRAESARQRLAELQAGTRREDVQSAEARYQQAEAAANLSRRGSRSEDIAAARAALTAAQAHVADLDVSLTEAQLLAPIDGIVETVSVRAGDLVPPGRIVLTMLEPSQLWVKIYVPETDLSRIKVGQSGRVTIDGRPVFVGRVGQIASEAEFLPRNVQTPDDRQHQVFGVKVYVDNSSGALKVRHVRLGQFSMSAAITADHLTIRFGAFTAVDDVSFSINPGEIFGFLGPNGSGKTTIIKALCGLLAPSSGTGTILGMDIRKDASTIKAKVGYMSQKFGLYEDLTVAENIDFYAGIYGLHGEDARKRKAEVISLTGLSAYLSRRAAQLSGGWKQRLALACAIIHSPQVVFLDEPTAGIDPVARRALWDLFFRLSGQGVTFFVTTHYMDEAERCGRLGYIYNSKLIAIGTVAELQKLPDANPSGTSRVEIEMPNPSQALDRIRTLDGVQEATIFGHAIHALVQEDRLSSLRHQLPDARIDTIEPSLEDVFVTLTYKIMAETK